jgi:predicted esterase
MDTKMPEEREMATEMVFRKWNDLYEETMSRFRDGRYSEAYDLITREGERFPEQDVMNIYLRSCLAARLGQPDHALDLLDEALEKGYWYGEPVMRQSPSWEPLQGNPRFERAVEICKARQDEERTGQRIFYGEPEGESGPEGYPLIIALHGNGDNAARAREGWGPATVEGWLIAALQSSQSMTSNAAVWDDQEIAQREVQEGYNAALESHTVNKEKVILAGFSMGGETALRAALVGTIPAIGFLLMGPGGPSINDSEPEVWLPLIRERAQSLRGYVLLGEQDDTIPQDGIRRLVEILNREGVPCEVETIPGVAHTYPGDSAPYVRRALDFIVPRQAT